MKKVQLSLWLLLLLCLALPGFSQKKTARSTAAPGTTTTTNTAAFDAAKFKSMRWRNIGPYRGGRSNAVSGVVGDDNTYYVGYTGGGVWKTDDAGITWRNISDGQFKTSSVGDIAVAESDPNVVYVGMGEHAVRGVMTSFGDGVYKSTDAGQTWKNIGLEKTRHISDVVVHPDNSDVVYVAAQGPVHGPSEDRGIYKSTDGGTTWKKVLYVDENTGASSLTIDMKNPRILYAAMWKHRRLPWKVESGPSSTVYKSTDGGETWNKIMQGLPEEMGKIGLSVSRANPNRVYAIVEAEKSKAGVYRSDNGGRSWAHQTNNQDLTARSWYYMEIFADPQNADVVYVLNAPMMRSIDGGKTFSNVRVGHGDTHDLWINPSNAANMVLGDDGGAEVTFNTGRSWSSIDNQPTAQFYRVSVDNQFPYRVYGGQQDNSSVVISSRTNGIGVTDKDWFDGPGCESAYIAFDPNNPELLYGGCYQGQIEVLDMKTMERKDIMVYPSLNLANEPKAMKYRFNWNAPILASPHDPKTIYHAGNVLFRSTNGGLSWETISPDLTRNDPEKQGVGGGPITNEGAGGENYNTIYYIIESAQERGVLYTGSDCGLVHVTRDNGKSWQNITPAGLPECMIHSIEVSPHDKGTVYISANRYKFNDFNSLTYKSTDYGKTWTKIVNGVDTDDFIKVIREDKKVKGLLYAGSERGFYISFDGGNKWNKFQLNLPVVPVTDLVIHHNDLVASTAGRAFWILDDLTPLQQTKGETAALANKLFPARPTIRMSGFTPWWLPDGIPGIGQNPLDGVMLYYSLKEKADTASTVKLEILDAQGKVVRAYSSKRDPSKAGSAAAGGGAPADPVLPGEAGLNRFAWDFRTATLPDVPGAYIYGDFRGHRVAPGKYKARLEYKGEVSETEVEVLPDPRQTGVTAEDWRIQQENLSRIAQDVTEIHNAINDMRKVKKQIEGFNELMKDNKDMADIVNAGKELAKKLADWEANLVETRSKNFQDVINWPSRLSAEFLDLRGRLDTHDPKITQGIQDRLQDVENEWNTHRVTMEKLLSNDISAYNQLFKSKNIP
ncbi:MAG: WD40/YVTN/BNR-like repeat-containing protein, partial [Saprospiraceae bacterium]